MDDYEYLYLTFHPDALNDSARQQWRLGTGCVESPDRNDSHVGLIFCPMPFEPATYTRCCNGNSHQVPFKCCPADHGSHSMLAKWGIGLGVILCCFLLVLCTICSFNKCSRICHHTDPEAAPRRKLRMTAVKQAVLPIDKRTLLKTGNYIVERSWDQVTVKFYNRDFCDQFREVLLRKYKDLNWKDPRKPQEGTVTNAAGNQVTLNMVEDSRAIVVSDEGNVSWIMNDFQNICKNVHLPEFAERRVDLAPRALSPRLATIGEEFYDAGDYNVKISQTEVEIKFVVMTLFDKFKRALLLRYPTLPWSKYLQRDCAQIELTSGKNVTIHLWEDVHSVWLSGDGKKDWYNQDFHEIYADAACGKNPESDSVNLTRNNSAISKRSSKSGTSSLSRASSHAEIPANYTVKTLDGGGFEIEFPSCDYVRQMKQVIEERNQDEVTWSKYSYRHVTKLLMEKGTKVTVHLGSPNEQPRKMWIYGEPACIEWFNGEFKQLYAKAFEQIHEAVCTGDQAPRV